MTNASPDPLEAIIAEHAPFVERLARALAHDPEHAADLVQDTWVAALRHPESLRGGGVRNWLSVVLRRRWVSTLRRMRVRRTEEFQAAADTGHVLSDVAVQLERQRLIQAALTELPEPYRTTLVLRFQNGLSAAEIASRSAVAPSTVRTQLQRGLAQMREQLDRKHPGGRAEWLAAFAVLRLPRSTVSAARSSAQLTGTFMGIKAWMIAALALMAVGYFTLTRMSPAQVERGPRSGMHGAAEAQPAVIDTLEVAPGKGSERVALVATVEPGSIGPADATATGVRYTGRVLDESDRPIEGASVRYSTQDNALRAQSFGATVATATYLTDADGRFAIPPPSGEVSLSVKMEGYALHLRGDRPKPADPDERPIVRWSYGDIVLGQGFEVTGRVLMPDGTQAAGASITPMMLGGESPLGTHADYLPEALWVTDSTGAFTIDGLPAGRWVLRARHPRFLHGETAGELGGSRVRAAPVSIQLRSAGSLTGTVRGLPGGYGTPSLAETLTVSVRPVTQNDDVVSWGYDENARRYPIRLDGTFEVTGILPGSQLWVDLWTGTYAHDRTERRSARVTAHEETRDVVLNYSEGFMVELQAVHTETRKPIHLRSVCVEYGDRDNELTPPATSVEPGESEQYGWPDGRVSAPRLVVPLPGAKFRVRLHADGMETFSGKFEGQTTGGVLDLGEIAMQPRRVPVEHPLAARISVVDYLGVCAPRAGLEVTFPAEAGVTPSTKRLRADEFGVLEIRSSSTGAVTAAIDPNYGVGNGQRGVHTSFRSSDMARTEGQFELRFGEVAELTLGLPEPAQPHIEVVRAGRPYPSAEVFLCGFDAGGVGLDPGHLVNQRQSTVYWRALDPGGTSTVERVGPGSWIIAVRDLSSDLVTTQRVALRAGAQVITVPFEPLELRGRVELSDGSPVPGALIYFSDRRGDPIKVLRRFHDQGYEIEETSPSSYASQYSVYGVSDHEGRFRLPRVALGADLFVYATARGHTTARSAAFRMQSDSVDLSPLVIEPASVLKVVAPEIVEGPYGQIAPHGEAGSAKFENGTYLAFEEGVAVRRGLPPGAFTIFWFSTEDQAIEDAHRVDIELPPGVLTEVILELP